MNTNSQWTKSDLDNFFILVDPIYVPRILLVPQTLASLLNSIPEYVNSYPLDTHGTESIRQLIGDPNQLGQSESERYASYMKHVKRNKYYQWLAANPHFKAANSFFAKQQQKQREPNVYRSEWAELKFLYIAGLVGNYVLDKSSNFRPKVATQRDRTAARGHAKSLLKLFDRGVCIPSDSNQQQSLDALLVVFEREMGNPEYKRPRNDANLPGRKCVERVTKLLLLCFSHASPTIVKNFARMMGYDADDTAIERHIKVARVTWQREWAKRLAANLRAS